MWAAVSRWLEAYWKWAGSLVVLNLIISVSEKKIRINFILVELDNCFVFSDYICDHSSFVISFC